MRKPFLLLSFLFLTSEMVFCDAPGGVSVKSTHQILQDPKTKIVYYLESDRQHVAAISPDGRILWRSEVASIKRGQNVQTFDLVHTMSGRDTPEFEILIRIATQGFTGGEIGFLNKKTGAFELLFAG